MKYYVILCFVLAILSGYMTRKMQKKINEFLLALGCCSYCYADFLRPMLEYGKDRYVFYHHFWLIVNVLSMIGTLVCWWFWTFGA